MRTTNLLIGALMLTAVAVVAAPPAAAWDGCHHVLWTGASGVVGTIPNPVHVWKFGYSGVYEIELVGAVFDEACGTPLKGLGCVSTAVAPAWEAALCTDVDAGEGIEFSPAIPGAAGTYHIHRVA